MSKITSYKIVYDEKQVELFQKKYYSSDNVYLMFISARKKYEGSLSGKTTCFKRTIVSGNSSLVRYLKHYEVPIGTYHDFVNNVVIPQHAIVVYTSVNSRNVSSACKGLAKHVIDRSFDGVKLKVKDAKIETFLHKCPNKDYVGIDLDTKDEKVTVPLFNELYEKIPEFDIIETRGGFHIIIHKKHLKTQDVGKFLYREIPKKYPDVDKVQNDLFSPIPGTLQGGFEVKFVTR